MLSNFPRQILSRVTAVLPKKTVHTTSSAKSLLLNSAQIPLCIISEPSEIVESSDTLWLLAAGKSDGLAMEGNLEGKQVQGH